MTRVGFPAGWVTVRLAMTALYLGLAVGPLAVYEFFFGGPLLGLPRLGLPEWLQASHPDAYRLLIIAHPVIDLSLAPLAAVFLGVLWGSGERLRHHASLQLVFWLALLATSMAVALSLGIHSTLAHIRL